MCYFVVSLHHTGLCIFMAIESAINNIHVIGIHVILLLFKSGGIQCIKIYF